LRRHARLVKVSGSILDEPKEAGPVEAAEIQALVDVEASESEPDFGFE